MGFSMLELALLRLLHTSTLSPPLRSLRGEGEHCHGHRGQSQCLPSGSLRYTLVYKL